MSEYFYILVTSYPHDVGFVHGVFTSYEKAEEVLNSYDFGYDEKVTYIERVSANTFCYRCIEI